MFSLAESTWSIGTLVVEAILAFLLYLPSEQCFGRQMDSRNVSWAEFIYLLEEVILTGMEYTQCNFNVTESVTELFCLFYFLKLLLNIQKAVHNV